MIKSIEAVKKYAKENVISVEDVIVFQYENCIIATYQYEEEGVYWNSIEEVIYEASNEKEAKTVLDVMEKYIKSQEVY